MTHTLYNSNGSGSFVVEAALIMAGADFTKIDMDMEIQPRSRGVLSTPRQSR